MSKNFVPNGWMKWSGFPPGSIYEEIYLGNLQNVKKMLPSLNAKGELNTWCNQYCGDYNTSWWHFTPIGVSVAFGKKDIFCELFNSKGIDYTSGKSGGVSCLFFLLLILFLF